MSFFPCLQAPSQLQLHSSTLFCLICDRIWNTLQSKVNPKFSRQFLKSYLHNLLPSTPRQSTFKLLRIHQLWFHLVPAWSWGKLKPDQGDLVGKCFSHRKTRRKSPRWMFCFIWRRVLPKVGILQTFSQPVAGLPLLSSQGPLAILKTKCYSF